MKRTLLFLIAMVAMVSAKATVTVEKLPISSYWSSTINGTNNFQVNFKAAWGEYKLTTTNFSIADYPKYRIYYQIKSGSFQVKTQNGTNTGDSDGQQETLNGNETSYEGTFNPETFGADQTIVKFEIQAKEANSSIRIEKIALLDGSGNEHLQYDGSLVWGGTDENPIIYYGANIQFTGKYGNVKLPVAALGEDGEVVTYTVKFRNPITKPVGFNYKYNGAEGFQYDWPQTNVGATEAVFTFKNTSAKYLTNLEMVEKSTGDFAPWSVEIESIEKTTTTFADMEPKVLYAVEKTISEYKTCVTLDATSVAMTSDNNLYILVSDYSGPSCDLRISNNDDWALAYPSVGYNFLQDVDANGIVKVSMTKAFFDEVSGGSKKQIAVWGNGGFKIKGIATTKETLLNSVTTDANGYATYSSNNTLALNNLPAGLEAYTATLTGNTLSFAQKTDAVGPGTGLLIKGGANKTYFIPATTDATAVFDNALKACVAGGALASTASDYIFVMQKATTAGSLTFKKLSTTGVTMPANKAYVQVDASVFKAHELSISFGEGEVTGISDATLLNINEVIKNNNVYDLSGRRVAKPTKGLYIVNGKKVVIK